MHDILRSTILAVVITVLCSIGAAATGEVWFTSECGSMHMLEVGQYCEIAVDADAYGRYPHIGLYLEYVDENVHSEVILNDHESGDGYGLLRIEPDIRDYGKIFRVVLRAVLDGSIAYCTHLFRVIEVDTLSVRIERTHKSPQGQFEEVKVSMENQFEEIGGFNFLIGYDADVLTFQGANVDSSALYNDCSWEYFTYRFGSDSPCDSTCPNGLLRVVGIGEMNNGPYHPSCWEVDDSGVLFSLSFLVSNDRTYECSFSPISFFWIECGDNVISSRDGRSLFLSSAVYDSLGNDMTADSPMPTIYGAPGECETSDRAEPFRRVDFYNGGIEVMGTPCCGMDFSGDINLNGLGYEIADFIMFSNYFLHGLSAFVPMAVDGSIAATDVNQDGGTLTVADLVYLGCVIVGTAKPYDVIEGPAQGSVEIYQDEEARTCWLTSPEALGALHLVFEGDVSISHNVPEMELKYDFDGTHTKALIFSVEGKSFGGPDTDAIIEYQGEGKLIGAEAGTFEGRIINTSIQVGPYLPYTFTLGQNYPNPFNAGTTIPVYIEERSSVTVTIFDVTGRRLVTAFDGELGAGANDVFFDGENDEGGMLPSGVYFYRVETLGKSSSRKMLLLK